MPGMGLVVGMELAPRAWGKGRAFEVKNSCGVFNLFQWTLFKICIQVFYIQELYLRFIYSKALFKTLVTGLYKDL